MTTSLESVPTISSLVGDQWRETDRISHDVNPSAPEEIVAYVHLASREIVAQAAAAARHALPSWSRLPAIRRADILYGTGDLLAKRADSIAVDLTREEGKTIAEARGEVLRAAAILRYFAGRAHDPIGEVYASANPATRIRTIRQPLGVVSIITPWNFPIAIPAWKIAPALAYGNTVVLKPASLTPLTAHHLALAFLDAGLPPGVLNVVHASGRDVQPILASSSHADALSFTGSAQVGRPLEQQATAAGMKVQVELGGKNAIVVCEDADLELAAQAIVRGAFASAGQKCTATSRVIAVGAVGETLRAAVTEMAAGLVAGNPLDPRTTLSPVVDGAACDRISRVIAAAELEGARVIARSEVPSSGWFVPATVLDSVEPGSRVAQDEVFGPVVAILDAEDIDEALHVHNRVRYGLAGSIFTRDLRTADKFVHAARVGVVHINGETAGTEPHVPFGGMGDSSSWSREQGLSAEHFFTQTKTVYTENVPIVSLFDF